MKSIGQGRLQYQATSANTNYYNIAKDLAALNGRNEEITDRKGNLFGYWCKVTTYSAAALPDFQTLASVPNTWKVRNAFRRFHFAREEMFRDAGITKKEMGKYGRTLRPYFNQTHRADGDQAVQVWDANAEAVAAATGGEWTYSTLGATVPWLDAGTDSSAVPKRAIVDSYNLTVLDEHDIEQAEGGTIGEKYISVGMVMAYVQDRMEEILAATAESSVEGLSNPLASLKSLSAASGEITEIAEDQQLEAPPYDITDDGDAVQGTYDYMPITGTTLGGLAFRRDWGLHFFPAGLVALTNIVANSNGFEIEVLGKELCKDVA